MNHNKGSIVFKIDAPTHLYFDKELHKYYVDGVELPSVTRIINSAGLIPEVIKDPIKANFGHSVHKAISKYINMPDIVMAESYINDHLNQFKLFKKQFNAVLGNSEEPIYDNVKKYAGTIDLTAIIDGSSWLIDVKSGIYLKWHSVQLSAYNNIVKADKCACLYLRDNGFIFKEIKKAELRTGYNVFLSALNIFNFKGEL